MARSSKQTEGRNSRNAPGSYSAQGRVPQGRGTQGGGAQGGGSRTRQSRSSQQFQQSQQSRKAQNQRIQGRSAQPQHARQSRQRAQQQQRQQQQRAQQQQRQLAQSRSAQSSNLQDRGRQAPPPQVTKKKKPKRSALSKVLLIIGIFLVLASLAVGGFLAYQYLSARSAYSDVAKLSAVDEDTVDASTLQVDWEALRAVNPDVVGWVLIPGTNVNYPIVQAKDNDYYLEHLFNGAVSKAGAVFLDCDDKADFSYRNNLVYGHNLIDGAMFASVTKYVDQEFFDEHHEVLLATPTCNYRLRAVCSLVWDGGDGSIRQAHFESDEEFHSFVQSLLNRAAAKGEFAAEDVDKMICLVTCSYQTDNSRTVLCLKPVKTYDPATGMEYREDSSESEAE